MRTTITLDDDVADLLRRVMRERGIPFRQAVNEAIRSGLTPARSGQPPFRQRTFPMGAPNVPLDRALSLVGELEDEETLRKLAIGK